MKPLIAITTGDIYGIGPEVTLKALQDERLRTSANFLLVGSRTVFDAARKRFAPDLTLQRAGEAADSDGALTVLEVDAQTIPELPPAVAPGPRQAGGALAVRAIEEAARLALNGDADAVVTAPISKAAIKQAGARFPGHTEMLAALTGAPKPVMFFVARQMRVALVTTHLPLGEVCRTLGTDDIAETVRILDDTLRGYFGLDRPRIAVCSLNPHAGEEGMFGTEETEVIMPAIEQARKEERDVQGPFPSDTVFIRHINGEFDAVVALYHDQAMIPVKLHGMAFGVNCTLGLPIIRTSPDHGTAYDIAWQGTASASSMQEAIRLAISMAGHKRSGGSD